MKKEKQNLLSNAFQILCFIINSQNINHFISSYISVKIFITINRDFDAVLFARNMRNLETIVNSLLDDRERYMVASQKSNCIPFNSDTTSSYSDENYDKVPEVFSENSKKLVHKSKVDKFWVFLLPK